MRARPRDDTPIVTLDMVCVEVNECFVEVLPLDVNVGKLCAALNGLPAKNRHQPLYIIILLHVITKSIPKMNDIKKIIYSVYNSLAPSN